MNSRHYKESERWQENGEKKPLGMDLKMVSAILVLMIMQTIWGFIAFAFNGAMIPFHIYVLKLNWGITVIITFVEWSADGLYIVSGIVGVLVSLKMVSPIVYMCIYSLYLVWGFIVVIFHALWINPSAPNYISWVAGLIGFVAAVLCWTFFFLPYLFAMIVVAIREKQKKKNSIEDKFMGVVKEG